MYRRILPLMMFASALALPACVFAQVHPDTRHGGGTPDFELYGGYSYVFRTYNPTSTTSPRVDEMGGMRRSRSPYSAVSLESRAMCRAAT